MGTQRSLGKVARPAMLLLASAALAGAALVGAAGCTISVQPWTKPIPAMPGPDAAAAAKAAFPYGAAYPSNGTIPGANGSAAPGGFPPAGGTGIPPGAFPPGAYPPNLGMSNESVSLLLKQLNERDDQIRTLQDRNQTLQKQTRERDDNLQHASYEMEASAKEIKRTREEVRQFAAEMDDVRERVRKLEGIATHLKPLIDDVNFLLDREKESPKLPRPSTSAK